MPALKIEGFDGLAPRTAPTALGDTQAQIAQNVKLYSGELRRWRGPLTQADTLRASTKTIYKLYGTNTLTGATTSAWFSWANDVDVAPAPTQGYTQTRIFYTGDGSPRKATLPPNLATSPPYPVYWQDMGVPAPVSAPTGTVTGTPSVGATTDSRVYAYTVVANGDGVLEESAPSPASSILSVQTGQSVSLTVPAHGYSYNGNIIAKRIYRSVAGASTDTYQFVDEILASTTSYTDTKSASQLGDAITTIGWVPPPTNLKGLVSLPFGSLAGFVDSTIYFSEPYYGHAWPLKYAVALPYNIVGLGVFSNTLVVCTDRYPYMIYGSGPDALSVERVPLQEPCVSKRSIASDATGVSYASPNGLVTIGPDIRALVTKNLFRRDEWQALNPANMVAAVYDDKYIGMWSDGSPAIVLSRDADPALSTLQHTAVAAAVDNRTGALYTVNGSNTLVQVDANEGASLTYTWKSKRFVLPQAASFSCMKLDANYAQTVAGTSPQTINVKLSMEGTLIADLTLSSWNLIRLPAVKGRDIEIEISGRADVRSVTLATTPEELRQ